NEGSTAIGDGTLVGMGTTQLSNLDEYYSSMGQTAEESGDDIKHSTDPDSGEGTKPDDQKGEGKDTNPEDGKGNLEKQLEEANRKETEGMLDQVSELTEMYNISGLLEVGIDPNGKYIELTINGSVLFESGKADLKKECLPLLSKVGDILKVYADHDVEVIGHTDNIPMKSSLYPSNDMLSSARAISAAHYLIDEKGVSVEHISWTGRGEYDPIDTNTTAEGRARNRRVEIRIYNSLNSTRTKTNG
ncbi:MAG: OmpA family protein, partial [Lachnospiraceae bacterium]|nr:OmpA family protein [Lachnospiraceae bacterium]